MWVVPAQANVALRRYVLQAVTTTLRYWSCCTRTGQRCGRRPGPIRLILVLNCVLLLSENLRYI